ncbi:MAG: T9SS type A sorting domain-containing protein [Candidatus Kapaibacteriota bacterium]
MKRFFVLFVFFFSALFVQAQYPVIGDRSDILWKGGIFDYHRRITFHSNSQYVAGPARGVIEILTVEDGKRVKTYSGYDHYFLKNGKQLAYQRGMSGNYNVIVQDFETDSIIFSKLFEGYLEVSFAISPEDEVIAVGSTKGVHLYGMKTGELLRGYNNIGQKIFPGASLVDIFPMVFLPDGKRIFFSIVGTFFGPRAEMRTKAKHFILDLETDSLIPSGWLFPVSITPDGTRMAYRGGGPGRLATVVDLRTNEEVGYVLAPPYPLDTLINADRLNDLSISPDGRYVLYTIREWSGRYIPYYFGIWDIEMNKLVYIFPNQEMRAYSSAFSPNGKYFAIGYSIYLFDFEKVKRKIETVGVEEKPQPLNATIVYPNPTHDVVQVRFTLDSPSQATIKVLDLFCNTVRTIEDKLLTPGEHIYTIDLTDVSAGEYFLQIKAGDRLFNEKIVVTH